MAEKNSTSFDELRLENLPSERENYASRVQGNQSRPGNFHYVPGSEEEKKLVRKVDLHLLPVIWVMYIVNYIDRSNIANAKVAGMQTDLHLSSNDYSLALLVFFIGYLLLEVPSNLLLSRTRPSLYLPGIMFVWGCICIGFKGVSSKTGLVLIRFFLGIAESGFFPGVWFLLSKWYRREELSKRFAIFYSAAIISGAFGSLLAGVITQYMEGVGGIRGWKWLFILEGLATVVVASIAVFLLPDWPATTRWLTEEEKELAQERLRHQANEDENIGEKQALILAFKDWRTLAFVITYMCIAGAGTIQYFIPTLVGDMGYHHREQQWMSAPPYAVTFVFCLLNSYHADRTRERVLHLSIPLTIAGVSYVIMAATSGHAVRYVFLCFGAAGIWTSLPVCLAYASECMPRPAQKRAVAIAIINGMGNLSSVYGSYLWPSADAPSYKKGFGVTCAFCFLGAIMAFVIRYFHGPINIVDNTREIQDENENDEKGNI